MVNKPGRRRRGSKTRLYLAIAGVIVLVVIGAAWYVYASNRPAARSLVHARFDTTLGSFEVELYASATPNTVSNFVSLAQSGFYDNLVWHRIEAFVIQTGDPTTKNGGGDRNTWGHADSGVPIPFEYNSTLHNYKGYLGMASTAPGAGGASQFYINLKDNSESFDGKYAVFGKVTSGMDVVQAIGSVPVEVVGQQHEPVTPVYLTSVTILETP